MPKRIKKIAGYILSSLILSTPALFYAQDDGDWKIKTAPSVKLSVVDGDERHFLRNFQYRSPASGGIEEFSVAKDLNDSKLYVDGRLLSERDFGLNLDFWKTNKVYFTAKADTFRYYYDSSNLYYAEIPGGVKKNVLNVFEIDNDVHADRGVYGFEGGMTFSDKNKVYLGYERKERDGRTDYYTGGWIRQFPANDWIVWEYPVLQEVDQSSDRFFSGIDTEVMGYKLATRVEYESFSGQTDHVEPGYLQNGVLVFRRFYRSNPDYNSWNFTGKTDRYFLGEKLLFNLDYRYQRVTTTSDFDVDSFEPDGKRHRTEHSLNFLETSHTGRKGVHLVNLIVSAFPVQDYRLWTGLRYKNGRASGDSMRGEEGAEEGVADNNPNTVDERWFFKSVDREQSLTELLGVEITSIPKTTLAFSADFEQKKTKYDWDANIVEVFAGTDDGDWHWRADIKDIISTYRASLRSKPLDWLAVSTKYRYKEDDSDLNNIIRNIEAKPGDPDFDATVPTNYFYPGRIGDWKRPSHKAEVSFVTAVNSRLSLRPYYEFYTEKFEVSGEPVIKEISDYTSNTFGLGMDLQPKDNLTVFFDISDKLAWTHTRSADFTNTLNKPNATWFGGMTDDFNSSSLSTSGGLSYRLNKYTLNFNSGLVKGRGLFDTELISTGAGVDYNFDKDTALKTNYTFYSYDEEDNGSINDYDAHTLYLSLNKKF